MNHNYFTFRDIEELKAKALTIRQDVLNLSLIHIYELDKELLQLSTHLTPEQKKRQVEMLRDIVGKKDS